jgi:hypothetical protein
MRARVSQLHKTEAEWLALPDFLPEAGEIIVYDPDLFCRYARVKIGDGFSKLSELPFFVDSAIETAIQKYKYNEVIDAGRITDY